MSMNIHVSRTLAAISKVAFCALAFLIPVTAFPWTTDAFDFNKYLILVIFATVAALAWIGGMVGSRSVTLKTHWIFILPILFVVATAVSSAFSLAPYTSWLGESGQEYVSFMGVLLFLVVFVTGSNLLADGHFRRTAIYWFLLASGLLGLGVILTFLGVTLGLFSNTVGVPTSLALYFLIMALFGNGFWLVSGEKEKGLFLPVGVTGFLVKAAIASTSLAALLLLLSVDSLFLWIITFIGLLPIFAFVLAIPKDFVQPLRFVIPLVFLVSALLFTFLPAIIKSPYPLEVGPSLKTSIGIVKQTWQEHSLLVGGGPGTYQDLYAKFAPVSVNQTVFWDTRFDQAANHLLTLLATYGVLSTGLFLAFLASLLALSIGYLLRSRVHGGWKQIYGPFAAWLVSASSLFLFPQNLTLLFVLTLLSALLVAEITAPAKDIAFAKSPRLALTSSFVFMLLGVGMLMVFFVSLSRYGAELAFAKAVARDKAGASMDEIIPLLNSAASRDRWSDVYFRNLGNALLMKTASMANDKDVDPKEMQAYVSAAINAGEVATVLGPNTVMNWELRGDIYRELSPLVQSSNDYALAAYNKAIELAPNNPRYRVDLGRAYIVRADLLQTLIDGEDADLAKQARGVKDDALKSAKDALSKAIELKNDYAPAQYYLSFVEEREGDLASAVASMQLVKATNPNDVGVGMQLALLYLRQGKNDLAQTELERILTIAPSYANAEWYLSVIYEGQGKIDEAISELEDIQKTNPDNVAVQQRLDRLKKGGTADTTIPAPIDDTTTSTTVTEPPVTPTP